MLTIDEVGQCELDKENTRLFFDLIIRRYNKEDSFNIVFTSNKHPSHRRTNFNEDDALLCTLDRIFDDAMEKKMRQIVEENMDAKFLLEKGNRGMIKRKLFEEYLNDASVI